MKEKMGFRRVLSANLRGMKELHKISPQLFPTLILHSVLKGLVPYVTVIFSAQILTELSGDCRADVLWKWVLASVCVVGVLTALKALAHRRYAALFDDCWGRKEILFCRKSFCMDYADIDDQKIRDQRTQISQNDNWAGWGFGQIMEITEGMTESLIGIVSGVALTVSLFTAKVPAGPFAVLNHPAFVAVFVAVLLAICLLAGKLAEKVTALWNGAADQARFGNRVFGAFGFIGMNKSRAVDIRMYEQETIVAHYWNGNNRVFGADGYLGKLARGRMGAYGGISAAVATLTTGFVYLFTCLKAIGGAFGVGSITQYVGAVTALAGDFNQLLQTYGIMKANTEHMEKNFEYLDIPNSMYQGSLTTEKRADRQYEVEFQDVSFKYPGSDIWALRHVNMKFKVGKRLAIVGENGSGKTTFIKLLCRLYDPQEGQILLNGIDIRKYRYDDYMNIFSVVFQDFQLICQPLGANVAGSRSYDRERVRKALIDAGFGDRLASMKKGLDTYVYKNLTEDGVDVSGGEAQKIAIARALYKDAPFIILDEPTAALDPIAEAEIYSKFNDIAGDKTAIYISHRLSSCKFCDEIAVFHEGAVIQQGTHDELVADENGKYHELWNAQAQYYTEKTD